MKRITTVFLLAMFCKVAYGQTDIELLFRAKDYITTKYTALILNNSSFTLSRDEVKNIILILNKNSLSNPFTYGELEVLLKEKPDTTVLLFISKLDQINISELTPLNPPDAIERINDEAYYISREHFGEAISPQLKKSIYEQILSELDTKRNEESNTALRDKEDLIRVSENKPFLQNQESWLWLLLIFAALAIVYAFLHIVKTKRQFIEAKQTIKNLRENKKDEKSKLLPVYNEFRSLVTDKLKEYEDNLIKLQKKLEEQEPISNKEKIAADTESPPIASITAPVIYMKAPSGNYFLSTSQTSQENAFYKLLLQDKKGEASFEIINDGAPLSEAIANPKFYLEPACFATNKPESNTTKIITSFAGMATRSGNMWIIKQKAIIVFA